MKSRKIRGITMTTNNEYTDDKGCLRCNECNTKLMLVLPCSEEWDVESECFKNGEDTPEDAPDTVYVGEVSGHWCPTCEMLVSLTYNFA